MKTQIATLVYAFMISGGAVGTALADIKEIPSNDLTNSYIQGISIQHVNKKVPCAGKKSGVTECNVAENLVLTDNGQNAAATTATSGAANSVAATQASINPLNNGTSVSLEQGGQRNLNTTGGALSQSGQQVNIQLFTPMPITTTANSTNVDISTGHQGATLMFNVPSR